MPAYSGYVIEISTPSIDAFPESAIREALSDYHGITMTLREEPGTAKPRLRSIRFPEGADLGKAYIGTREVPDFGQQAMAYGIQSALARLRPLIEPDLP